MTQITITQATDFVGTSFHGQTINTTLATLRNVCGNIDEAYDDGKTYHNFDLNIKVGDKTYFCTVYDWKEYREIDENETITWHIGAENAMVGEVCKQALETIIKK